MSKRTTSAQLDYMLTQRGNMTQTEKELIEAAITKLEKKKEESASYTDESNFDGQIIAYRRVLDLVNGATEAFKVMNGLNEE